MLSINKKDCHILISCDYKKLSLSINRYLIDKFLYKEKSGSHVYKQVEI